MSLLNILVLHRMGDPMFRRESVRVLEYMIPECRMDINCVVHDADLPFPEYLKGIDFHLIVLGPTFLCSRYHHRTFTRVLHDFDFIRESSACKVALPQDDYDCSGVLDEWMVRWRIDLVYAVCPENWDVLYPTYMKFGEVRLGYTGYIPNSWIDSWTYPKPHNKRLIDISYRASKLPANFGSLGVLKAEIARKFVSALPAHDMCLDISANSKDMIPSARWHSFIEDSRFCLATASGSSLLDVYGNFRQKVNEFYLKYPNAGFEEIERHCFPGQDRKYVFTAISPRNIEAALAETVQIATPGTYSGLMQPLVHYIPLNEDCSNIRDVMVMMSDHALVDSIKRQCKVAMLDEPRLRRTVIVDEILQFAESVSSKRNLGSQSQALVENLFAMYGREIEGTARKYWPRRRVKSKLKSVVVRLGGKYINRWLIRASSPSKTFGKP